MGCKSFFSRIPVIGGFLKHPVVPVIRLSGVIAESSKRDSISYEKYRKIIDKAFSLTNLKAVAIVINCPGGTPAQAELLANYLRRKSDERNVPLLAFVEDLAASGGYWLACAADEIYAAKSSITGSIGVVSSGFGLEDFINRYDIKRRLYTQGKEKALLDPFLPERESDIKRLEAIQKKLHEDFIDWVKNRRGDKLKGNKSSLFEGQIWLSADAQDKGIIDGIGDCEKILKEKFGEDFTRIDLTGPKKLLSLPTMFGASEELKHPNIAEHIYNLAEERAIWARYGF